MLVLSRKIGESIRISDNIFIQIVAVHGDQIKLGIVAPRETLALRSELIPPVTNYAAKLRALDKAADEAIREGAGVVL